MSFAEDLKKIKATDYNAAEKEQFEKEKQEAADTIKDQIIESLTNLKKRGELKEHIVQGFFYAEYWWNIIHFCPYDKDDLIKEAPKKGEAEYYIEAFLIKAQKIYGSEVNIFAPLTVDDVKKILKDLGFKNVGLEILPLKYYRKCRMAETIFREYVKDEANVYYFTFEY